MDATEGVAIRLDRVGKTYADGTVAVGELSLDVPRGETVVLVGPSGCGKSTTLKMVNRLIEPTRGRIVLDGQDVTHGDPVELRRRIGYVIQHAGLFPHQTVWANVATVPRLLGWPRPRVAARVEELLELVGLDPALHGRRYPHQLSGGQRQRVGVARALAADPPVLLMDEPFGAVDPIVRDRLQAEFLRLQAQVRKTVLFVTHDVDEAVRLGDRIAVLGDHGTLAQYDRPARLLAAPAGSFVADFVGADRAIKRLAVTPVTAATLVSPLLARAGDGAGYLAARMAAEGHRWALVLDDADQVTGWVDRDALSDGRDAGTAADPVVPTVAAGVSLREALSVLLTHRSGWVLVRDGERPLGLLTSDAVHQALQSAP